MPFSLEVLADVSFGVSNNISIQAYSERPGNTIKMKFTILKKGLKSGTFVVNSVTAAVLLLVINIPGCNVAATATVYIL